MGKALVGCCVLVLIGLFVSRLFCVHDTLSGVPVVHTKHLAPSHVWTLALDKLPSSTCKAILGHSRRNINHFLAQIFFAMKKSGIINVQGIGLPWSKNQQRIGLALTMVYRLGVGM